MMKSRLWSKRLVIGILLLSFGISMASNITGDNCEKTNTFRPIEKSNPSNITITDWTNDVWSMDPDTQEKSIVLTHPDINIENLDITQVTYLQQGTHVILTLQVVDEIENRNIPGNPNTTQVDLVFYGLELVTSDHYYLIEYCNQSGLLHRDNETINLTASYFSVVNDTLCITFSLFSDNESYESLYAVSIFRKIDLSGNITANLFDRVPDYHQKAFLFGRMNILTTAEDHLTIEAVNLRLLYLSPLHYSHYYNAEKVIISDLYKGRIFSNHFLIGMFDVLV